MAILASIGIGAFLVLDYMNIVFRAGDPTRLDIVLGTLTIFLVMEATRRTMGWPLVIVAGLFLAYALWGHFIPGSLGHRQYSYNRVIEHMFLTAEGIYGVSIYVTATYVFIFILLGAFLTETGGEKSFIDLAFAVTGRFRGGTAKAGVGASGTAGGLIMPPIMGVAAVIMAEMTGVPYSQIIICAAIPAVLYYIAVFTMVDMEAAKTGLKGLPRKDLPRLGQVFKEGAFLLIAPLSILYMLIAGYSPIKASVVAVGFVIVASVVASLINGRWMLTPKKFYHALVSGAQGALSIVAACAVAGIIVGVVTLTGLGLKFADLVMFLAQGSLYPALLLTMCACIIMSMGMPTTALYIILGAMVAPGLVKLDVNIVAAHFFIFYYGCMAAVTPPVALSSYLAASIAGADPTKTAFQGLKLALAAFILPFIFVLDPSLLLINTTTGNAIIICLSALLGITAMAASLEGYFMRPLQVWQRAVLAVAALVLIIPGLTSDLIGAVLCILMIFSVVIQNKAESKAVAAI